MRLCSAGSLQRCCPAIEADVVGHELRVALVRVEAEEAVPAAAAAAAAAVRDRQWESPSTGVKVGRCGGNPSLRPTRGNLRMQS